MASKGERLTRDQQILIARAKGETPTSISERWGLTPARVRQILAVGAAQIPAEGLDPVQVAYERRSQFEEIMEKALAIASEPHTAERAA
jgi:hypothetical protein